VTARNSTASAYGAEAAGTSQQSSKPDHCSALRKMPHAYRATLAIIDRTPTLTVWLKARTLSEVR
jgi:hypothetical protein